ncbi:glycosyltransferase family 4 protein [Peribacillus sp. FSL R5-0717]|uniref:glycosyltransferase family 4 protein n=1 Tax=Peribacillus sp. FSL R5-0717 TaxID=2975308 RepID=UPI0030F6A1BA
MKSKIGIIGHFAFGKDFFDGQTVKTKILYNEFRSILGNDNVLYVDTYNYKKNVIRLLFKTLRLFNKSENVVINLSTKGRYVFIPLCYFLKKVFGTRVHCMVIGGGFPEQMKNNKFVRRISRKIDGIYVETTVMLNAMHDLGYDNVYHLNNFKKLTMVKKSDLNLKSNFPLKICTFSRVIKEKGIEDIIEAITRINQQEGKVIYYLDIYGQIGTEYQEDFEELIKKSPDFIRYKGIIDYDKSVDVIKEYFLLAFPTLYKTEGVPGTIIDAYASGVPVISSDWNSCKDVVDDNSTGIIFKMGDINDLISKLKEAYTYPQKITSMKENCLDKAFQYSSHIVIPKLLDLIDKD